MKYRCQICELVNGDNENCILEVKNESDYPKVCPYTGNIVLWQKEPTP